MTKLTLDNEKQVFFYEQDFYVLSNFSSFSINYHSFDFPTAEHLYHYLKFDYNTSKDNDLRSKCTKIKNSISTAKSAHEAFKIAQECKEFRDPDWDNIKFEKMLQVLRLKVEQHEYVKKKLLETGDRELIENSWRDDVWGWGENRDGQNALGKLWMVVRSEIKLLEDLKNPSKEGYVTTPDGKTIYRKGVINPVQNAFLHKHSFKQIFVTTDDVDGFNSLISNLRPNDQFHKRIIKDFDQISEFVFLEVDEVLQTDYIVCFKTYDENKNIVETYTVINKLENIRAFIEQFIESKTWIGMYVDQQVN